MQILVEGWQLTRLNELTAEKTRVSEGNNGGWRTTSWNTINALLTKDCLFAALEKSDRYTTYLAALEIGVGDLDLELAIGNVCHRLRETRR